MGLPMRDVVDLPAEVYRKILRHSLKGFRPTTKNGVSRYTRWNEIIGALIGKFKGGKVEIVDAIELGEGTSSHVLATDYSRIFEHSDLEVQLLRDDPDRLSICGWYHSHPGFGFFLSGTDKTTQTYYQRQHEQAIALVVDPTTIARENDVGIRVFRIHDDSIFGIKDIPLEVTIVGLEKEVQEILNELIEELGFDRPPMVFHPELEVETSSTFHPTPLDEIQVKFEAPARVAVGEPFSLVIAVEGIKTGVIRLKYELILPENLFMLSQPGYPGQRYHEVMTNGTIRVLRIRADIETAFDLVLENIVVTNFYESFSLGRQELTVVAI